MLVADAIPTVNTAFFQPLTGLASASQHARPCPEFPDEHCLRLSVQRGLELSESGRAFLQEHGGRCANPPRHANDFAALQSQRRRAVLRDVHRAQIAAANPTLPDRLAEIPALAGYEGFATDGPWHKAATQDARHEGRTMAAGHFYSLNRRTHTLRHLAAGAGLHAQDRSALQRVTPRRLRQDVPQGRRGLLIPDTAGMDFNDWKRGRQARAVYCLSRVKENMVYEWSSRHLWDRGDKRNQGVTDDRRIVTRAGPRLRILCDTDPVSGERCELLTNVMALPPGVLGEWSRRRWEAEKGFDPIKNKLGEKQAWATGRVAKESQALLIAITHHLLVSYEQALERQPGVTNRAEDRRRAQRVAAAEQACVKQGTPLSSLVLQARRATQRSVKFIRWLRQSLRDNAAETVAVLRLKAFYATL